MRPKSLALLMLALGCGLVASIGITQVMANRNKEPSGPPGQTQPIFVAMTDIGMGDMLTSQVLKLEQWPKDRVPEGAISRIEDVEGRRARTKLYAGEPILDNKLLGKGASEQGATALIPRGYRVVPVKVDLVSGGSSLILPGDRVDVMVHLFKDRSREIHQTVTKTILQDVKIFAVNDVLGLDGNSETGKSIIAKTISLLVTPDQAAKVTLASQLGIIQLVMRSPEDDEQVPNAQATPSELFGTGQRDQESPLEGSDANKRNKEFLDFLNSMKGKLASGAAPTSNPHSTWTMRVVKLDKVEEVCFEEEPGAEDSAPGTWKVTATTGNPAPLQSADEPPMAVEPPSATPPAPPAEPREEKPDPQNTDKNKDVG